MNYRLITAGAAGFLMRFFKIKWFNLGSELKGVQREHTDILKMLEIFPPNSFRLQNINTFLLKFTNKASRDNKFRDKPKILFPHRLANIWQRRQ